MEFTKDTADSIGDKTCGDFSVDVPASTGPLMLALT